MSVVVGHRVAGQFTATEALWDNPGRGRYRGADDGGGSVLIAVTAPQVQPLGQTAAALALDVPGVAPLLAVGLVDTFAPLHALVEAEPAGAPLSALAPLSRDEVIAIGGQLAELAARAHDRGLALGGLRPELCYAVRRGGGVTLTEIAPRAIGFFRAGGALDAGNVPAFEVVFEPFDLVLLGAAPSPASDVFTLAAGLGTLASGRHPFAGESWAQQAAAMGASDGGWPDLDDPLLRALEPALRRNPAARPNAADLRARLAALM
jgi:hypothetical protein